MLNNPELYLKDMEGVMFAVILLPIFTRKVFYHSRPTNAILYGFDFSRLITNAHKGLLQNSRKAVKIQILWEYSKCILAFRCVQFIFC